MLHVAVKYELTLMKMSPRSSVTYSLNGRRAPWAVSLKCIRSAEIQHTLRLFRIGCWTSNSSCNGMNKLNCTYIVTLTRNNIFISRVWQERCKLFTSTKRITETVSPNRLCVAVMHRSNKNVCWLVCRYNWQVRSHPIDKWANNADVKG